MDSEDLVTVNKFGTVEQFRRIPGRDMGDWPVISETVYMASIIAVTALAVVVAIFRTFLRFTQYKRLDLDDAVFTLALICTILSSVFTIYCMDFFYVEVQVASGTLMAVNLNNIVPMTVRYLRVLYAVTALQWISIFGVKMCYLVFFRKLTQRLPGIRIWWWVVLAVTVASFIFNATFGAYICPNFGDDIFSKCPLPSMTQRSETFNQATGSLDIVTDVLIISIPLYLITKVRINLKRKLAVASILSLSCAMVAVSLIRLFPPPEAPGVVDTVWYIYWISFEAAIAIIMVSVTGFRSIFSSSNSTRGSSSRRSSRRPPTKLAKKFTGLSSRMGRFFVWNTIDSSNTNQLPDGSEASTNGKSRARYNTKNMKDTHKTGRSFFFQWSTHAGATTNNNTQHGGSDEIYSIPPLNSDSSSHRPLKAAKHRPIDISGVSTLSSATSPLSTKRSAVSPLSSMAGTQSSHYARDMRVNDWGASRQSRTIASPKPAVTRSLDNLGFATRRAAQEEYETRAMTWSRDGRLSPPPTPDLEKGFLPSAGWAAN